MIDAASATSGATTNSTSSRDTLAENFEMFLLLLTEQMKNQDPLSPLDSNEFVTQLVQFSGVEQSIRQNDHLETLVGLQVANVGGAAVGYLGKEVRVNSPIAPLGQNGASWAYEVAGDAESVSIAVLDSTGKVVFEATGEIETAIVFTLATVGPAIVSSMGVGDVQVTASFMLMLAATLIAGK